MEKDHYLGLVVLVAIIVIAALGSKAGKGGLFSFSAATSTQTQNIQEQIQNDQTKVENLENQLQSINDAKTQSKYKGIVTIQYVNYSGDATSEYAVLRMTDSATSSVDVTGWQLHSVPDGTTVEIPQGTQLYFNNSGNIASNVVLYPGDTAYVITGASPLGFSFRLNKCSGYLSQFQTFIPYIYTNCPAARDMDLSSIPRITQNDDCLDYINSFPSCKTQTDSLPLNWSYECKTFITNKLNYSSCVDTYKTDTDFYQKDWRIYLGRSAPIWKSRHEEIVLYDNNGKIVDDLKY